MVPDRLATVEGKEFSENIFPSLTREMGCQERNQHLFELTLVSFFHTAVILPIWASLNCPFSPNSGQGYKGACKWPWLPGVPCGGFRDHIYSGKYGLNAEVIPAMATERTQPKRKSGHPAPSAGPPRRISLLLSFPVAFPLDFDTQNFKDVPISQYHIVT